MPTCIVHCTSVKALIICLSTNESFETANPAPTLKYNRVGTYRAVLVLQNDDTSVLSEVCFVNLQQQAPVPAASL